MTTRTLEVIDGETAPDVSHLDRAAATARLREIEARQRELRGDPSGAAERVKLGLEREALQRHVRILKVRQRGASARRHLAGLDSPLYEVVAERVNAVVLAELERAALERLADRERRNAERKAKRAGDV